MAFHSFRSSLISLDHRTLCVLKEKHHISAGQKSLALQTAQEGRGLSFPSLALGKEAQTWEGAPPAFENPKNLMLFGSTFDRPCLPSGQVQHY